MNSFAMIKAALFGLFLSMLVGCGNGDFSAPEPFVPRNEVEALSVSDEDFDYAAVFEDSGRGIIPP